MINSYLIHDVTYFWNPKLQAEYGSVANLSGQQAGKQNKAQEKGDQGSMSTALVTLGTFLNILFLTINLYARLSVSLLLFVIIFLSARVTR